MFFGLRLSRTPTSPNWNEPSTRQTFLPSSVTAATAALTAIVVRPTPPFGLKNAMTWPRLWWDRFPFVGAVLAVGTTIRVTLSRSRDQTWRIEADSSSLLKGLT